MGDNLKSFFTRATVKTIESFEKLREDAEKSFGIEVAVEDPVMKELLNYIVDEEEILLGIQSASNQFIHSVSVFANRDTLDLIENIESMLKARGTDDQRIRMQTQLNEFRSIRNETTESENENSIINWLILELQSNVLTPIEQRIKGNETIRGQFRKLREDKRKLTNFNRMRQIDKNLKSEIVKLNSTINESESELLNFLVNLKKIGIDFIDGIWNEYCRIEAEFHSKMNDSYLEPPQSPTPDRSITPPIQKIVKAVPMSPVIADDDDGESSIASD
jgi:hypothetical protein